MSPLDIFNIALKRIGGDFSAPIYDYLTPKKEHKMNEGEHITLTKIENGFTIQSKGRTYQADDMESLAAIIARTYGLGVGARPNFARDDIKARMFAMKDVCEAGEPTANQLRDEVGELRRFKIDAIARDADQNRAISHLTDVTNDYRERYHDALTQCSATKADLESAEELSGNLYKQIEDMKAAAKVKAKVKKKSVRRKA